MSSVKPLEQPSNALSIAIVGNDALIEALPARPIQFAHACRAAGFDVVLPGSWGDELVADATLRKLESLNGDPAVFCSCPIVRQRLLASGADLAPLLIAMVAPPVALARYARALYSGRVGFLAYIGDCPAARSTEFDVQFRTRDFLDELQRAGIDVLDQPLVFDAVLPPDRRRFVSLPGGCPSSEMLWQRCHERVLVGLERDDLAIELAQHLLARQPVLVDVAAALGCFCSGVTPTTPGRSARVAVMSLEPPRTSSPVVDSSALSSLESPYPSSQPPRTDVPHPATSTHLPTTESEQPSATPVSRSGADVRDPTMPPLPSPRTQRAPLAITPARVIAIMGAGTTVEPVDVAPRSFPGQLTAEQFPDLPSAPGMPKGDSLTSDQRRDILTGGPTTVADRESREDTEHTATLLFPGASGRPAPAARSPARTPGRDFPAIRSIGLEWATLPRAYMPWRPRVKRPGVRLASKRRFRLAPTGPGETVVTASTPIDAAQPPTTAAPPVQPRQTAIDEMRVPAHAVADELARAAKRDRGIGRPLWTLSRLVLALAILALIAALIRWRMF